VRKNLTDRFISALKPSDRQTDIWDTAFTGFGLRLSRHGKKSFQIMYRHNRVQRRMVIGSYPVMSLADARKWAKSLLADVAKGHDPAAERLANRNAGSFGELASAYLKYRSKPKKRRWREDERIVNVELLPAWKTRTAKEITRRDIRDLVQKIADRGAGVMANRTLSLVRQIFNYGVDDDWLELNPCQRIPKPGNEVQRDRYLVSSEISAVWEAFENEPAYVAAVLRLQLLTGQRIGEVQQMRVDDVDIDGAVWTIPSTVSKNKRAHRVPLSKPALRVVEEQIASAKGHWLFASPTNVKRHVGYATIYYGIQRISERAEVKDWGSHTLRHTVATHLAEIGESELVIGKILNHTGTGATKVYIQHGYDPEKRMALDAWARRLDDIIQDREAISNVVPISVGQK
jgi:integrase